MRHAISVSAALAAVLACSVATAQDRAPIAAHADHVALQVADVDASSAFYSSVFELAEVPTAVRGPRWLDLGGGLTLHLIGGRSAPATTPRAVHLALSVSDLAEIARRLDERDVVWTDFEGQASTVNAVRADGVRQIFFQDPDGYWVEVNDRD